MASTPIRAIASPMAEGGEALDRGVGDHRGGGHEGDDGQREVLGRAETVASSASTGAKNTTRMVATGHR